jgi:hypothetical protein
MGSVGRYGTTALLSLDAGPGAWGPIEKAIGHGFANRPLDTVGIQYGLKALMNGLITPAQFVDLNAKVGGHDIDYNAQPNRRAPRTRFRRV